MSQFEYSVPMAIAKPSDINAVALAYRAGQQQQKDRIISLFKEKSQDGYFSEAIFAIEKMIIES